MHNVVALSRHTGLRLAEVGFLLIVLCRDLASWVHFG
jgi:hypothetical protein